MLADSVTSYKGIFDSLLSRIADIFATSAEPYLQTGLHYIIFEAILKANVAFTTSKRCARNASLILARLFPFVMYCFDKYSFQKQIICCLAYREMNLFEPRLFTALINSLNNEAETLEKDEKAMKHYLLDEFTSTDLWPPLLNILSYAYHQEELFKWLETDPNQATSLPPLNSAAHQLLVKHIGSTAKLRDASLDTIFELYNILDYPCLFTADEHKSIVETVLAELMRRDVVESEDYPGFIEFLARVHPFIEKTKLTTIMHKVTFELGLRLNAMKDGGGATYETLFELSELCASVIRIVKHYKMDEGLINQIALLSLSLMWNSKTLPSNTVVKKKLGRKRVGLEIKIEAEKKVRELDQCCTTVKNLLMIPRETRLSSSFIKELIDNLNVHAAESARILSDEINDYMRYFCDVDKEKKKETSGYPEYGVNLVGQLTVQDELTREKVFLGQNNVEISKTEYEKIVSENDTVKDILGYDMNTIVLGKAGKSTTTRSVKDLAQVLKNLFSLTEAVAELNLDCGAEILSTIKATVEKMFDWENSENVIHVFTFSSSENMEIMRSGLSCVGKLTGPQAEERRKKLHKELKLKRDKPTLQTIKGNIQSKINEKGKSTVL